MQTVLNQHNGLKLEYGRTGFVRSKTVWLTILLSDECLSQGNLLEPADQCVNLLFRPGNKGNLVSFTALICCADTYPQLNGFSTHSTIGAASD